MIFNGFSKRGSVNGLHHIHRRSSLKWKRDSLQTRVSWCTDALSSVRGMFTFLTERCVRCLGVELTVMCSACMWKVFPLRSKLSSETENSSLLLFLLRARSLCLSGKPPDLQSVSAWKNLRSETLSSAISVTQRHLAAGGGDRELIPFICTKQNTISLSCATPKWPVMN